MTKETWTIELRFNNGKSHVQTWGSLPPNFAMFIPQLQSAATTTDKPASSARVARFALAERDDTIKRAVYTEIA